jgi:spoIIIJ-associated protein
VTDDSTTEADLRPEDPTGPADDTSADGAPVLDGAEVGDQVDDDSDDGQDEAEIAADYIEELLDICDLDGDIEIEERAGRVYLSVTDSGDSLRVLSKPDTVTALQELTRIAVQSETGEFSRLILDVGGSRDARASELGRLVDTAIERIEAGSATASLPPMSSYERKLVHDLVSERGFHSESEGEGRDRHTVVTR